MNYIIDCSISSSCTEDCQWDQFGTWTSCTKPCDRGSQSRTRLKKEEEKYGGEACTGNSTEYRLCNIQACPINCEWDDFNDWGQCSKSCGGGIQRRNRSRLVEAKDGGKDCDGKSVMFQLCNTQDCLGNKHTFETV